MSDKKRINGDVYSWGSIILKIEGDEFTGIFGIDYSQKRERSKQYGTGRAQKPRGRSKGKYSAEGKITVPRGTMADLINFLADKSEDGVSYGDVVFQMTVQYVEADETPMLVELEDCVIAEESVSDEEGNEGLKDEITLDIMGIKKNGKTLYSSAAA
jgi:hypothetical protein